MLFPGECHHHAHGLPPAVLTRTHHSLAVVVWLGFDRRNTYPALTQDLTARAPNLAVADHLAAQGVRRVLDEHAAHPRM
jgi:hypothetical protein